MRQFTAKVSIDHNLHLLHTLPMTPKIDLTQEQILELNGPFTHKEAREHAALGFAQALAEHHILPSSLECMLKAASLKMAFGEGAIDFLTKGGPMLGLTLGAVGGTYAGYAHNKIDKVLEGRDDPKVVELKRKIEAYKNMSADLKRTSAIGL